jgi:hypothetical protein
MEENRFVDALTNDERRHNKQHNNLVLAIVEEAKLRLPDDVVNDPEVKVFSYDEALRIAGFAASVGLTAGEYGSDISVAARLATGESVFSRQQPSYKPILEGEAKWQQ